MEKVLAMIVRGPEFGSPAPMSSQAWRHTSTTPVGVAVCVYGGRRYRKILGTHWPASLAQRSVLDSVRHLN